MSYFNQHNHHGDMAATKRPGFEPSDSLEIRCLNDADAKVFRMLRLEALREFPESFGMTYAEERDTAWPDFFRRFQDEWSSGDNVIFGAFLNGRLVGSLGLRRWTRDKQRHKGYIWIFYVMSEARGKGMGRRLLIAVLQYAHQLPELTQIQLSVSPQNQPARSLYVSFGFESFGLERAALRLQDRFIDLELMTLQLS